MFHYSHENTFGNQSGISSDIKLQQIHFVDLCCKEVLTNTTCRLSFGKIPKRFDTPDYEKQEGNFIVFFVKIHFCLTSLFMYSVLKETFICTFFVKL